jgi:YHS domain-containing protein
MKQLITIFCLFCLVNLIQAQDTETTRLKHYNLDKKVALSGYDPVTYFVNKPVKGKKEYNYTHKGVVYYFISEKSKSVFVVTPEKFEPAYGGWCAYALAKEEPVLMETNPKTYKIIDGKLYMFYDKFGINKLNTWNEDEEKYKKNATKNWEKIISE